MCTIITHPAVPLALSVFLPETAGRPVVLLTGVACSVIPDLDVIGFRFNIGYGHLFGHRGFTHSIFFAALLGAVFTFLLSYYGFENPWTVFLFLFVSTLSHSILDAFTNGGLGVAFFAPFINKRYFFPRQPIEVSPIGIRNFFSRRGKQVILSEIRWVWLPSAAVFLLGILLRFLRL